MLHGINKVILIGRLGNDPEIRYTSNGVAVANFSIATTMTAKDKQTNVPNTYTEWHRITAYQKLAEIAGEFLKKGSNVYIEGRLHTKKWTDKDGIDRYTTEIIVKELQFLDSKAVGQGAAPSKENNYIPTEPSMLAPLSDSDDDIPF